MSSFMLCCSCRLLPLCLLRPSRSLPASGPDEPPEQQRTESEADRVQEDQLAVGRQQRPEQQRRDHGRYRQPLAPPDESAHLDRESLDLWNQFLDVHRRLLSVVDPCRHPWRRSCAMGLTSDALRPRPDAKRGSGEWLAPGPPASRTQRGQGRRRRSSARVFSVGIDCWELLRSGGKKDAARPGSTLGNVRPGEAART